MKRKRVGFVCIGAAAAIGLRAGVASAQSVAPEAMSPVAPVAAAAPVAPVAQEASPYTLRPSVMMGLMQWVVFGGGNVAAQVKFGRWVAEYSHGQALQYDRFGGFAMTADEREAGVALDMPWTTGGGFGFQITSNLHVLIEAKVHRYEVRDAFGGELGYTSFTLGPGVFYDLYLWKGLFLQPNVRWWPTVASTYDSPRTLRTDDGAEYRHARHDLMPFVNMNLGWTFSGK